MKASLPRVFVVMLLGFIVAGTTTPLLRAANTVDDLRKAVTSSPYTWDHGTTHYDLTFNADGTGSGKSPFKWQVINAQLLYITWLKDSGEPNGSTANLTFNQDYSAYSGTDTAGKTFEMHGHRIAVAIAPPAAATPAVAETAIDTIVDTGPGVTASVLVPLNAKQPLSVRTGITTLREQLLDEAAKAPASSPETYKAAAALCDSWLAALDERDKTRATQASHPPMGTADMGSGRPVHPDDDALEQEAIDAKKKKQDDAKQNAFFSDAQKQAWQQRCAVWQKQLDQLYAQMNDLRRKAGQAASATPKP